MRRSLWALVALAVVVAAAIAGWVVFAPGSSGRSAQGLVAFTRSPTAGGDFGGDRLYLMRPDGSGQRNLGLVVVGAPIWSPDGSEIAFETTNKRDDRVWIDVVNRNGSQLHRVTPTRWLEDCFSIAWSPDSRKLALTRVRGCEGDTAIYVLNADGTHLRRLAGARPNAPENAHSFALYSLNPAWSPDGRMILFTRGFGKERLWVMRADGSEQRSLDDIETKSGGGLPSVAPAWSANGRHIFFLNSESSLIRVDRDGRHARRLLPPTLTVRDFALSPNSFQVAVDAADQSRRGIYVVKSDGRDFKRLTNNVADCCPSWSPDGRQIMFGRNLTAHDNSQIYVISAGGGQPRNLSHNNTNDGGAAWAPAEQKLGNASTG